jgi:hypothetical protein
MKIHVEIIIFLLLITNQLFAEEKKAIQVKFKITEPQYVDFYGPEIGNIEEECTAKMIDFLNQTFSFFHFTEEINQHLLYIQLADNEQNIGSHSNLKEVGFKLSIKPQENLGIEAPVYWVFRPWEKFTEGLPEVKEEFIDKVFQTFKIGLLNNKEELVKNILSRVKVADDFYFIKERESFILPMSKKENNIAEFSLFLIITSVPDIVFGTQKYYNTTQVYGAIEDKDAAVRVYHIPNSYPAGSLALKKVAEGTDGIPDDLPASATIEKKIFILKHIPLPDSVSGIISPETFLSNTKSE